MLYKLAIFRSMNGYVPRVTPIPSIIILSKTSKLSRVSCRYLVRKIAATILHYSIVCIYFAEESFEIGNIPG